MMSSLRNAYYYENTGVVVYLECREKVKKQDCSILLLVPWSPYAVPLFIWSGCWLYGRWREQPPSWHKDSEPTNQNILFLIVHHYIIFQIYINSARFAWAS